MDALARSARHLTAEELRAHGGMVLFAALISVSFSLGQRAAPHIAPEALTIVRFAIAAALMGVLAWPGVRREHLRAAWRYPVLGGLISVYFVLMFEALRLTDPVSTAAVFTLTPAMSAGFGWLLLRQVTTARMATSIALAGAGAFLVIFRADFERLAAFDLGRGEMLFFVGCVAHALYAPLVRALNRGEPVRIFTTLTLAGGLVPLVLWGWRDMTATAWTALPAIVWVAALYLGIVATAGTFFLLQFASLRLRSAQVMAYGFLVPVFVVIWEGIVTGMWVAGPVWIGVAAIVAALSRLLRS